MITHLQISYPQHPGQAFPIAASNGQTLPTRARSDTRPKKGYPVRILTRAEWDDQNKVAGPYLAAYQPMRPVPDVDFEAEDGSLHPTAEACLAHELQARFGVETLAEVEAQMKALADKAKLTVGDVEAALYDKSGNPPFSGVPETDDDHHSMMNGPRIAQSLPPDYLDRCLKIAIAAEVQASQPEAQPTPADCARLLATALSQRGHKVAEAATATGLTPAQVRATAKSLPGQFVEKNGRVFLVS
jgi:hypothetical protein